MIDVARLTVEAPVYDDDAKNPTTGVFEFAGDLSMTRGVQYNPVVGGAGGQFNAVIDLATGDDSQRGGGFRLDLGAGLQTFEIEFVSWDGADNDYRWGDGSGDIAVSGVTQGDAQGARPRTQMAVLMRYLSRAELDSRNPAILEFGEHHDGGLYEPWTVAPQDPQTTFAADRPEQVDGALTFVNVASINSVIDGIEQNI